MTCWWSPHRPPRRERRSRLESKGVRVEVLEGADGRVDLDAVVGLLAREKYLSLMIEAGSRVNWTALESRHRRQNLLLLRAENSGRHAVLAGRRRHWPPPPRRRHSVPRREAAPDHVERIRGGGMAGKDRLRANMFTGIIEELGTVVARNASAGRAPGRSSAAPFFPMLPKDPALPSTAFASPHLRSRPNSFAADLAPETLSRTNLGGLAPGARVNLERPVTPATRFSGHIVQGHIDATGDLIALDELGDGNWWLKLRVPAGLDRYMVHKGSIAIDGISLTIAALDQVLARTCRRHHHSPHIHAHNARPGQARHATEHRGGCAREAR